MDTCLESLGLSSPTTLMMGRKRSLILLKELQPPAKPSLAMKTDAAPSVPLLRHRDSLDLSKKNSWFQRRSSQSFVLSSSQKQVDENDDDDTCSTATATSSSTSTSLEHYLDADSKLSCKHVRWADDVVSEVRFRPFTSRNDKYHLFYSEYDYMDFKMDYVTGRQRSTKVVSFALTDDVVEVPAVSSHRERRRLFYSEKELQTFLDDFVLSLNDVAD